MIIRVQYAHGMAIRDFLISPPTRLKILYTVALIEFASRSLPEKVHLKKKSGGRKTRRCWIGNQIPYSTPSSFFWLRIFFGVNFCMQTPGTYLHHTVSMVGLPDPVLLIFPTTCTEFTKIRENFEFTKTRARAPPGRHAVRKPASGFDQGHSMYKD